MALCANHSSVYVALHISLIHSLFSFFYLTSPVAGIGASAGSAPGLIPSYDVLYYTGVRAYFSEEWEKAAELLEKSMTTREALFRTRRQCHEECLPAGHDRLPKLGVFVFTVLYVVDS